MSSTIVDWEGLCGALLSEKVIVLTRDNDDFRKWRARFSKTIRNFPVLIAFPRTDIDVSTIVKLCRKFNSPFAVAGGRHTTSDASSCTNGLIIDLHRMRTISVCAQTQTIRVGGGARWGEVNRTLATYELAAVGPTVEDVGVGGSTLGGGYGWLSGRYGLIIDNLLSAKIVLADGRIITTSPTSEPDLFWAIRGAGQSFGVVVEFEFQAYEQKHDVWSAHLVFHITELENVIWFANRLMRETKGESAMVVDIAKFRSVDSQIGIRATVFHNGPAKDAEQIFGRLLELNPVYSDVGCAKRPYHESNEMMFERGLHNVSKGASFTTPLRPKFVRDVLVPQLVTFYEKFRGSDATIVQLSFHKPDKWCEVPVTETAHGHRGYFQSALVHAHWARAKDNEAARQWCLQMALLIRNERAQHGTVPDDGLVTEYGNYDHLSASPQEIYGVNYPRLVELKKRYDPDNIQHKIQLQDIQLLRNLQTQDEIHLQGIQVLQTQHEV
ncbi:hypothetical protein BJX61DRAFT_534029 [Aspergillus egyptiacus]|nr:hypothetical protein BJX61DRAFT_534029 [Aspergillus egyptiacus]